MKILFTVLIGLLLLPVQSWADVACGTVINVPGTYVLDGNKACDGTWLTVAANNVSVNMQGYAVTYANVSDSNGVVLSSPSQSFELYGGTLTEGVNTHARTNAFYTQTQNITGLQLHNLTINTVGVASNGMHFQDLSARTYDIGIHDNTINITPHAVTVSAYYPNGIWFDGGGVTVVGAGEGIFGNTITMGVNTGNGTRPRAIWGMNGSSTYRFPIHDNIINLNGAIQQGISSYGNVYQDIYNNTITATATSNNVKLIALDGGSNHTNVHNNTLVINSTNTDNSYGVQNRYASTYNNIYNNTINVAGASGASTFAISIGSDQAPTNPAGPSNNLQVYANTITSGNNHCINLSSGLSTSRIYCNTCSQSGSGYGVNSTLTDAGTTVDGVIIENNIFNGGSGPRFRLATGITFTDVDYCGNALNSNPVVQSDFSGVFSGITITNLNCSQSCDAPVVNPGVCGSANLDTFNTAPTTNLCTTGTASPVTGQYNWTCTADTVANCSASYTAPAPASASSRLFGPRLTGGVKNR